MTACSNDDAPVPVVPQGPQDVTLSIGVTSSGLVTKASTDGGTEVGKTGEANLNRLTALIFNSAGDIVLLKDVETGGNFVGDMVLKEGTYDIQLVANAAVKATGDIASITSKTGLASYLEDFESQTVNNLVMISDMMTVTLESVPVDGQKAKMSYAYLLNDNVDPIIRATKIENPVTNYPGDPVVLTRMAARIQLEAISISIPNTKPDLVGSTFTLQNAYFVNVRPQTFLVEKDAVGYTGVKTFEATAANYYHGIAELVPDLLENGGDRIDNIISIGASDTWAKTVLAQAYNIPLKDTGANSHSFTENQLCSYAYENQANESTDGYYNTRLVIKGTFVSPTVDFGTRYYQVVLRDALKTGETHQKFLTRNKIYKITLNLTGLGAENSDEISKDDMCIEATIDVANWIVVDHTEYIDDEEK